MARNAGALIEIKLEFGGYGVDDSNSRAVTAMAKEILRLRRLLSAGCHHHPSEKAFVAKEQS